MKLPLAIVGAALAGALVSWPAVACGPRTLELVKMLETAAEPPVFACGSDFNELLKQAHQKNWSAALAAYEAHLSGIGKSEANTKQADETLAYLKAMAAAKR